MKIYKMICVIIALLMLGGCGKIDSEVLSYAERPFCAEVKGQMHGLDFSASVQVSARNEDGGRNIRIQFVSPESLRGIVVTNDGKESRVDLDGVSLKDSAAEGWMLAAQLLIPQGQVVSIKSAEQDPHTAVVLLDSKQTIIIDVNTGAPLEAAIDGTYVKVTRFESTE